MRTKQINNKSYFFFPSVESNGKYLLLALILHIAAAWFSVGRYHADEQFQILEFTGYKTGVNTAQQMPWEFHEKIRPAIQIAFAFGIIKTLTFIHNPFIQAFVLRLFAALLGLLALYKLLQTFRPSFTNHQYQLLLGLSAVYCFIPWFHARYSSENISASLFILGLSVVLRSVNYKHYFVAGILLGLSCVVRMQSLFMLGGLVLWMAFIYKNHFRQISTFFSGFLFAWGIGLLCDYWFYGEWVNTTWNYIYQNIVLHKSEQFGSQPVWFYFTKVCTDAIPPFSIIIIAAFIILFVFQPRHVLSFVFVPFLFVHILVPHKELRFLFPLINFIPLVVMLVYRSIQEKGPNNRLFRFIDSSMRYGLRGIFLFCNTSLLLFLCFKPADDYTPVLKFLYQQYGNTKTLMFCNKYNPYDEQAALNFYKSSYITAIHTTFDSICTIQTNKHEIPMIPLTQTLMKIMGIPYGKNKRTKSTYEKILVVACDDEINNIGQTKIPLTCVYTSIPGFLFHFNFNNWIARAGVVKIYEINTANSQIKE